MDGKWVVIACDFRDFRSEQKRCLVNILLLSLGGGGGNIRVPPSSLSSRDLATTQ